MATVITRLHQYLPASALLAILWLAGCHELERSDAQRSPVVISPNVPQDILSGAETAGLRDAARFAWQQFFALVWPAVPQTGKLGSRGKPNNNLRLSDARHQGPLVWETFRSKTEIFPGLHDPHGRELGPEFDYGFDHPPRYRFDPAKVGRYPDLAPGQVPACESGVSSTASDPPWINLSEAHEVGPERMFAGAAPKLNDDAASQRIFYAVKGNRVEYTYVAANNWYDGQNAGTSIPYIATQAYVASRFRNPPAGSTELVSFPVGSTEIKSAWRRLSASEVASGRFYITTVRFYRRQDPERMYAGVPGNENYPCYVDGEWGLLGMHIKTKTASAPYSVWATFEQADTLLDATGHPVEDEAGVLIRNQEAPATDPPVVSRNAISANPATVNTIQRLFPALAQSIPGARLYYTNAAGTPTPQGTISVNRRLHAIPPPVIEVNREARAALDAYLQNQHQAHSPWRYYKLVSVQWRPADKPVPGEDWTGDPNNPDDVLKYPAVYYQANITMETSHRLQKFSGQVQARLPAPYAQVPVQDLISDFDPHGRPVKNVQHKGERPDGRVPGYNMGGCMGCHGQMQRAGYDFSFILRRGRVDAPEVDEVRRPTIQTMLER